MMKFPSWLRTVLISVVSTIIVAGLGFGGWQYYQSVSFENAIKVMEDHIQQGATVLNCQELSDAKISNISGKFSSKLPDSIKSAFHDLQTTCDAMTGDFRVASFFDPENNFRSTLVLSFSYPVTQNLSPITDADRKEEKEKIKRIFKISPDVVIDNSMIDVQDNAIILEVDLEAQTNYTLSLKSDVRTENNEKRKSWSFTSPENNSFLIRMKEGISLYDTNHTPHIQFISYDSRKNTSIIKVCKIDLETYAKIEIFLKNRDIEKSNKSKIMSGEENIPKNTSEKLSTQEDFFYQGIDTLMGSNCAEVSPTYIPDQNEKENVLFKQDISLFDTLEKLGSTGLYVATYADKGTRMNDGQIQRPLLFGVVNAHILMKNSGNGETFFFATDFTGTPLSGLDITASVNEYTSQEVSYELDGRKITNHSPLDTDIYSSTIQLGKTDKEGILKVNIRDKITNYFHKTFDNQYEFDEMGKYDSFFVTAKDETHLSYVSSKWNSGIAPWNFGYTVNMWYNPNPELNAINLNEYIDETPYYSHVYTDRVLYLPGEKVEIKSIIRNSADLSVPKGQKFYMAITDNQGKELQKNLKTNNEFGSIFDQVTLQENIQTGVYAISLTTEDGIFIGGTNFTVEVFKKPKFKTEIQLSTEGLDNETVLINTSEAGDEWYLGMQRKGSFTLKADLIGRYYSGGVLSNSEFTYRIFRQPYYDTSYWTDCFYGCYWEPQKELYTEGTGKFDNNGGANLTIPINFVSSYDDYRYILEVTPRDVAGDTVSSTNSILARLPDEYKSWNPNSAFTLSTEKRFYPTGHTADLRATLSYGTWDKQPKKLFYAVIKKKEYTTTVMHDVRGFDRPLTRSTEKLLDIIPVDNSTFTKKDGKDILSPYKFAETGEYIVEFGTLDVRKLGSGAQKIVENFSRSHSNEIEEDVDLTVDGETDFWTLANRCVGSSDDCNADALVKKAGCEIYDWQVRQTCLQSGKKLTIRQKIKLSDLLTNRQYFTILTYSEETTNVPEISDNKIQVLTEKVSYHVGEKARILVRLPFSHGKILWTVEKKGVEKSEYIDVPGNVFFKEITIDESFMPNAYIGVFALDTQTNQVTPEYKVGYTEVVIDKTDKKSVVNIKTDKNEYSPRDTVTISLDVKRVDGKSGKHEVSIAVVDDSLISMMGNIDTNTLEKIWRKLPFQIQTSITNIAMLKNYYFSRPGIVGGSGNENNKGGDGVKSTRTIFKNTAFYKGDVITDENGHAVIAFRLPDNLTQFRVIAVANTRENVYGSGEAIFTVKKPVIIEDKTPFILYDGDKIQLGGNVFNNTGKDRTFDVSIKAEGLTILMPVQQITLKNNENTFVKFEADAKRISKKIPYTMSVLDSEKKFGDSLSGVIDVPLAPVFINSVFKNTPLQNGTIDYSLSIPDNTDMNKSIYSLSISNNPLQSLESIISSLLVYPYGCIEQSVSSTIPNVLVQKFAPFFKNTSINLKTAKEYTKKGLDRIVSMQLENGGFGYWQGDTQANLHITPYVTRSLMTMREMGAPVDQKIIDRAIKYLTDSLPNTEDNLQKVEIFLTLAKAGKGKEVYNKYYSQVDITPNLNLHEKITYLDALVSSDAKSYNYQIEQLITTIQKELRNPNNSEGYYWYWNTDSDKAHFADILMRLNYERATVLSFIQELSERDYDSYFVSTQAKNAVFMSLLRYMQTYTNNQKQSVQFTLQGKTEIIELSPLKSFQRTLPLSTFSRNKTIKLSVASEGRDPIFVNAKISAHPLDATKIKSFSSGITLTRTIQEVTNTQKLALCDQYYYSSEVGNCQEAFSPSDGIHFKKGATYKITLKAKFSDNKVRRNLTLEDYLPATFRVLQSNFKTNTIITSQSTGQNSWAFDHIENLPNVVMAHASYMWDDEASYSYYVIPEFSGTFLYPPATAYLMYNPDVKSFGEFRRIEVK